MKAISFFMITALGDVEGRSPNKDTGIAFTKKKDAIEFVKSSKFKGNGMGKPPQTDKDAARFVDRRTVVSYDSLHDYKKNSGQVKLQQLKDKALEKLSPQEISRRSA